MHITFVCQVWYKPTHSLLLITSWLISQLSLEILSYNSVHMYTSIHKTNHSTNQYIILLFTMSFLEHPFIKNITPTHNTETICRPFLPNLQVLQVQINTLAVITTTPINCILWYHIYTVYPDMKKRFDFLLSDILIGIMHSKS